MMIHGTRQTPTGLRVTIQSLIPNEQWAGSWLISVDGGPKFLCLASGRWLDGVQEARAEERLLRAVDREMASPPEKKPGEEFVVKLEHLEPE